MFIFDVCEHGLVEGTDIFHNSQVTKKKVGIFFDRFFYFYSNILKVICSLYVILLHLSVGSGNGLF